ncbi:hypothetical protein H8356DRAFT_1651980 [Neocallimastix lanati (nom. inval.)]|nr:hypothetical protein H8356DRAFT_1651980 [Neocallimastix sp. JGI-2020a]
MNTVIPYNVFFSEEVKKMLIQNNIKINDNEIEIVECNKDEFLGIIKINNINYFSLEPKSKGKFNKDFYEFLEKKFKNY